MEAVIGAAQRMEGFGYLAHGGVEPGQHVADDVIAQDEDARFLDLRRQVAIAEVPSEFNKMQTISGVTS